MTKYDLVFEGGGAKGMVFVGACEELFGRGNSFDRLLGTSAGAITATLLAAGYTTEEMLAALVEKENGKPVFAGFMGEPPPFSDQELRDGGLQALLAGIELNFLPDMLEKKIDALLVKALAGDSRFRHVMALVDRGGWYAADRFVTWLENKLDSGSWKGAKRAFSRATLSQLHEKTGVELSLVATDTTDGRILVLNHRTAPACPIVWAVRMSMSIPLVWDEVTWREEWGPYLERDITRHLVVDGGVLSNFPIELFISAEKHVTSLMGSKRDSPVLGMLIDEELGVPGPKWKPVTISIKPGELRTVQRLGRLVDAATRAHDKMVLEQNQHLVVRLPAKGYGTTEFDMTDQRRDALVAAGRLAMKQYLDSPGGLVLPTKTGARGAATNPADRIALGILQ